MHQALLLLPLLLLPLPAAASAGGPIDLTGTLPGLIAAAIFLIAYLLVVVEEFTQLRKSMPVVFAAGLIWAIIGAVYIGHGQSAAAEHAVRAQILDYAELLLFMLVAMTYINAFDERRVFDALQAWVVNRGWSLRRVFWATGLLAFFISPLADNLATAMLLCAVVLAVGRGHSRFIGLACTNVVVAANAGGAFSPFGDITTVMVWQRGVVDTWAFFALFLPALVSFLVPASGMQFAVPNEPPRAPGNPVRMRRGALRIVLLFVLTIATAVALRYAFNLPPMLGMMTGLAYLQFFGYYLKKTHHKERNEAQVDEEQLGDIVPMQPQVPYDVFNKISRSEWDTLLFFFGVVLSVGGLGFMGYLSLGAELLYGQWGATVANVLLGIASGIVDNIPVMFAVLTMNPAMDQGQWLLATFAVGVGGSLLSIGSAAGVALMGQAWGHYSFFKHLRWTPVIAVGYAAGVLTHLWLNAGLSAP